MQPEIEAVFCNINKDELRAKLTSLGAILKTKERKMIRVVFKTDQPGETRSFLRVRDEGNKIVITYKKFIDNSVTGVREINLTVDDYEKSIELFRELGFREKSYEESLRETWEYEGAEIDIDTWPWIPPYVEIEGRSVENMTTVSEKLGFSMADAVYGTAGIIYKKYYDISEDDINAGNGIWNRIEFTEAIPEYLRMRRRLS